jgi:hypothetical protein
MSAEIKGEKGRPCRQQCSWPECVNAHVLMRIVRNLPVLQQSMSGATLEERAQDSCKRRGASISLAVQHPHIAKSLMPVDNEPKLGWQSRFAAIWQRQLTSMKKEKRFDQLRSLRLPDGRRLMDYYVYRNIETSIPFFYFSWPILGFEGVRDGVNLGKGCFEKLQRWFAAGAEFSPYREKVAEELLL